MISRNAHIGHLRSFFFSSSRGGVCQPNKWGTVHSSHPRIRAAHPGMQQCAQHHPPRQTPGGDTSCAISPPTIMLPPDPAHQAAASAPSCWYCCTAGAAGAEAAAVSTVVLGGVHCCATLPRVARCIHIRPTNALSCIKRRKHHHGVHGGGDAPRGHRSRRSLLRQHH